MAHWLLMREPLPWYRIFGACLCIAIACHAITSVIGCVSLDIARAVPDVDTGRGIQEGLQVIFVLGLTPVLVSVPFFSYLVKSV